MIAAADVEAALASTRKPILPGVTGGAAASLETTARMIYIAAVFDERADKALLYVEKAQAEIDRVRELLLATKL